MCARMYEREREREREAIVDCLLLCPVMDLFVYLLIHLWLTSVWPLVFSSHAHVCMQTLAHTRLQSPCFVYDIASGITCLSSRGWEAYVRVSLSLQVVWMSDVRFTRVSVCARESLLAYTCARAKTTKQKREASEPTGLSLSSPPFHSLV